MPKNPKDLLLRDPHVRHAILDILQAQNEHKGSYSDLVSRQLRSRKNLSSVRRRTVSDVAFDMIRYARTIEFLLSTEDGMGQSHLPDNEKLLYRYVLALMVCKGIAAKEIAESSFPEPVSRFAMKLENLHTRLESIQPESQRIAIKSSTPDWIVKRLSAQMGLKSTQLLLDSMNERAPFWLRANILKQDPLATQKMLESEGYETSTGQFSPWSLKLGKSINIQSLRAFKQGYIEAQDEGSQLIAEITGATPGQRVIDYCAGAGGKSLAMGAMMKGQGDVLACDIDPHRLNRMRPRLKRSGLKNISFHDLSEPRPETWSMSADCVLVDAPCTGSGTFRRQPERKYSLNEEELDSLPQVQLKILQEASEMVRSKGRLVYATCSVFEEENLQIINRFLEEATDFKILALTEVLGEERAQMVGDGSVLRMMPHTHDSDGFFGAVLQRR